MKTIIRNFLSILRRYRLATALNVLGLSVAFAAFLAIMIQVDYDRNFDRCHRNADRIFRVEPHHEGRGFQAIVSRPFSEAFFRSSPYIEAGTIATMKNVLFFSAESRGEQNFYQEDMSNVTPSFVDVFAFDMIEGDGRALDDPEKALIPHSLAKKFFGDEPATGKILQGRDRNYTVGGVYRDFPRNSTLGNVIYTSMDPGENINHWGNWNYVCYIRVSAAEHAGGLFENFKKNFDWASIDNTWYEKLSMRLTPLPELHYVTDVYYDPTPKASRRTVYILLTIAFVIVTIAGINYTNFSAALAPRRIRSINTQKVFGGSTAVIRTALVLEGVVICLFSFLLALGMLAAAGHTPLTALIDADLSPVAHAGTVSLTAGLALLTGLLAGLYPSFYVTSVPPAMALKGSFGLSAKGRHLRNALISVQFIASFVLIISASFMFLQNRYMQHAPLGYDRDELLVTHVTERIIESRDAFDSRLKGFAGIEDVTYAQVILSSGDQYMGWGRLYHDRQINYQCLPVEPSFLRVMGIEVMEGRDFREDDKNTRHGAYIFNEKARGEFGLVLNDRIDSAEIVGFMPDVKFASFRTAVTPMAFYIPGTDMQNWLRLFHMHIKVKAGADLRAAMTHVRQTLKEFDGEYPFNVHFFDEVLNHTYEKEQRLGNLITLFSLVAIFISIVGVFGLVIFDSEYRRREIGIRKVFGATTREILVAFNRTYVRILCLCFLPAAPVAWYAVTRWLESFAYRTPMYWWVYPAAFAVVFALTVATVTFQNRRAANANPIDSIKAE
jgi:putative ABC transport system permease protein